MNENSSWIGILLIVILLVGGGVWYGQNSAQNKQASLEDQQRCAESAIKYYQSEVEKQKEWLYTAPRYTDYKIHYNFKLKRCFIMVSSSTGEEMYDVLENELWWAYGSISGGLSCANYPNGEVSEVRESAEECEQLIRPYMTE